MANNISRRRYIATVGTASTIGLSGCLSSLGGGGGSDSQVNLGVVTPLSGTYAITGKLVQQGAEFAAKEINENGGIKSLDGAEINLVTKDAGDSEDSATTAMQDLLNNNDIDAGLGAWLSSFTLAIMGQAEREQIPWFTVGWSDQIVNNDNNYIFQGAPLASEFAAAMVDNTVSLTGSESLGNVALFGDNTAGSKFVLKPLREDIFPKRNTDVVSDRVYNPPLADPTSVVREWKNKNVDFVFYSVASTDTEVSIREKIEELNVDVELISSGVNILHWNFLEAVGGDLVNGTLSVDAGHVKSQMTDIAERFIEFSDQPVMIQAAVDHYGMMHAYKEALEEAGTKEGPTVRDTLKEMTISSGPAVDCLAVDTVDFEKNGHLKGVEPMLCQWQERGDAAWVDDSLSHAPFVVAPEKYATRDPQV